ncbi:MAG: ABC transporter substrate-binding protein [Deltaproteobacteria bacterium]|nr:ABC transporter substrate-binding protein [Deltaproteobacteria bacterium]
MRISSKIRLIIIIASFAALNSCTPNNPYRSEEKHENTLYSTFDEVPKHMDPARSYSENEYAIIAQIYEPPLEYHYLKRPYELIPLTLTKLPEPAYYDKAGKRLGSNATPEAVARAEYDLIIKKGLMYQDHPALAKNADSTPVYANIKASELRGINGPDDFKLKATRELTADDYIYAVMRLADPKIGSPIAPILSQYILGFDEFSASVGKEIKAIREERKKAAGATYNRTEDEKKNPIRIDYSKHEFKGLKKTGTHSFKIILKRKYPQFSYWLAMPFFAPMPKEADVFYNQPALADKNITLDRFPIGTGPYFMKTLNPRKEIVLEKNPHYSNGFYPTEGEAGDKEAGLLKDAGKPLPLVSKIVMKLEIEAIPRWNKFLQGYYDLSGITSDSFDAAVAFGGKGVVEPSDEMKKKGIALVTLVKPSSYFHIFNMNDKTVGGYSEEKKKLRRAISIALDQEEFIEIFTNGRGVAAMTPIPPKIFGYEEGSAGINPLTHEWDATLQRPKRKSLDEAKRLLKEAGYPDGRDKTGRPLTITFDNAWTGAESAQHINWYIKQFAKLGISLVNRTTDGNRFQEKMTNGDFQFAFWGWNADYPDPENFMFLLYGPNGKVKFKGENGANYSSAEFDRLFKIMENMDNSGERLEIIRRMNEIAREDAPWAFGYHPVSFTLKHGWAGNYKPNAMANNEMKYYGLDALERAKMRDAWNRPVVWPVIAVLLLLVISALPAIMAVKKKFGAQAKRN